MKIVLAPDSTHIPWHKTYISEQNISIFVTGYAFIDDMFLEHKDFLEFIENYVTSSTDEKSFNKIKELIPLLNGSWSLIIKKNDNMALAAVDRSRSYPLFFAPYNGKYIISDHTNSILKFIGRREIDETAAIEFLLSGYVSGRETLYQNIEKLLPGEFVEFECNNDSTTYKSTEYFTCFPKFITDQPKHALKNKLAGIIERIFFRYSQALKGKTVVVPLSGGFDSRIICLMLRKYGHKNILSYTYGEKDNPQNKIAEQLSLRLGIPWHFIEYNPNIWATAVQSSEMTQYWEHACRGTSSPHIQDFPGLLSFFNNGELEKDQLVFLPGHVGDAWASEFVIDNLQSVAMHPPSEYHSPLRNITSSEVVNTIVYRHHNFWPVQDRTWRQEPFSSMLNKLIVNTNKFNSPRGSSMWCYVEWVLRSRTALWINNSCRSFEFFNSKFMTPLADYELIDFFRKLPLNHLIYRNLYQECLKDNFFFASDSPVKDVPLHSGASSEIGAKRKIVNFLLKLGVYKSIEKVRKPYKKAKGLASDSWFTRGCKPEKVTVADVLKPYNVENVLPKSIMEIIRPLMHRPSYSVQCNGLLAAVILAKIYTDDIN